MVFLDEIFNANSAILNSLLMALNERVFRRGKEHRKIPALMFVGASNQLPEDESLNALLDRFLIRVKCDYVDPERLEDVLIAGRKLASDHSHDIPKVAPKELIFLQQQAKMVDLSMVRKEFISLIHSLRNTGVNISDRRAVKVENLISASAIISGRNTANLSDLWVLKYIWDTEEQIEVLAGIVDKIIDVDESEAPHPQASFNRAPDPEELLKEIESIDSKWDSDQLTFEEKNLLKDKLRYLQTRTGWISKVEHKDHIESAIEAIWEKMLKEA
jgi:MoxR-like ATPase